MADEGREYQLRVCRRRESRHKQVLLCGQKLHSVLERIGFVASETIDYSRLNAMQFGDVLFSQRSIRRFKPDPISMDDLHVIMEGAVRAPNGGNAQPARFVLITDRDVLEKMGALYKEAWWAKRRDEGTGWKAIDDIPVENKNYRSAARLANSMSSVPAMILAFGRSQSDGSSVIPAIQNLMLAARALGIGSLPTRLHPDVMDRVNQLLGVPETASLHLLIPLGYPSSATAFGVSRRKPTSETVFLDHWDHKVPWD
jgi:nitroreductase